MALEGNLQDMSLVDLFRIFRMGQKTGRLLLFGKREQGIIFVAAGRLIDAAMIVRADRQVIAVGEEAVLQLLQWEDSTFAFQHDPATLQRPVRITRDSTWLMLEGLRRRTQPLPLPPHQHITLDTQLELAPLPANAERSMDLDMDQWRLLNRIATSQNMRTLCMRTGMGPDNAIRIAGELVAIGLIDIVATEPAIMPYPIAPTMQHDAQALDQATSTVGARSLRPERGLFNAILRRVREL